MWLVAVAAMLCLTFELRHLWTVMEVVFESDITN